LDSGCVETERDKNRTQERNDPAVDIIDTRERKNARKQDPTVGETWERGTSSEATEFGSYQIPVVRQQGQEADVCVCVTADDELEFEHRVGVDSHRNKLQRERASMNGKQRETPSERK